MALFPLLVKVFDLEVRKARICFCKYYSALDIQINKEYGQKRKCGDIPTTDFGDPSPSPPAPTLLSSKLDNNLLLNFYNQRTLVEGGRSTKSSLGHTPNMLLLRIPRHILNP